MTIMNFVMSFTISESDAWFEELELQLNAYQDKII